MPIAVLCPHCGRVAQVDPARDTECPLCHEAFPEELLTQLREGGQAGGPPPLPKLRQPLFLTFQTWLGFILAFLFLLSAFAAPDMQSDPRVAQLKEMDVHLPQYPAIVWMAYSFVRGALLLAASLALRGRRYSSRMLLMLTAFVFTIPEPVMLAPGLAQSDTGRAIFVMFAVLSLGCLGLAYWYLYSKRNVVAWYEVLREQQVPAGPEDAAQ